MVDCNSLKTHRLSLVIVLCCNDLLMGIEVISHGGFVMSGVSLQVTNALIKVRKTRTVARTPSN